MNLKKLEDQTTDYIREKLHDCDDERAFVIYEALKRGVRPEEIHEITKIDNWFLYKLLNLIKMERSLADGELTDEKYLAAKKLGFLDETIEQLSGQKIKNPRFASYKMVDTCAAEFAAETPYFYSTYDEENEAEEFIKEHDTGKKKSLFLVPGRSGSDRGLSLTTAQSTVSGLLRKKGMRRSSATTIQKRFLLTLTPATGFILTR